MFLWLLPNKINNRVSISVSYALGVKAGGLRSLCGIVLCRFRIQTDRMHLMEHIRGIIFGLQLLQLAQLGTIDVGNSRVTGYHIC